MYRWLKDVLLDFFQFYTSAGDDDYDINDKAGPTNITQSNENNRSTREYFLRTLAKSQGTPLTELFPTAYMKRRSVRDDNLSDGENDLNSSSYPPFDEVIRLVQ